MRPLRIYIDASVIGGCFDDEFAEDSRPLFAAARDGRLILLISDVVLAELVAAPPEVQNVLQALPLESLIEISLSEEVLELRDAYVSAGVIGERWIDDAAHVAAATVARADAIVSWNFKHIVRLDRIKGYNQVNLLNGYGPLVVVTPKEVIFDE